MLMRIIPLYLLIALLLPRHGFAVEIVRLQMDYNNSPHILDLELFDDVTPATVENYLDYVTSGSYDGSFIYRNVPGFIIQTGGYTFRPADPLNDPLRPIAEGTGLELVPDGPFSPVVNEFNLSNIRGTIAMAKVPAQFEEGPPCTEAGPGCTLVPGTGADSATREWFINLDNNSENLDNQNGGFTVFGSVIDDGIAIADEIATYPIQQFAGSVLGSAFANLPVVNYDTATFPPILRENLVMITSAAHITRPVLRASPASGDLGLDIESDGLGKTLSVTLKNTGNEALTVSPLNNADLLSPFSIQSENCSNTVIDPISTSPTSSCAINFKFEPLALGLFTDDIPISYSSNVDSEAFTLTYDVSGEGVPGIPVLSTSTANITFPETVINSQTNEIITVQNKGGGSLIISSIELAGTNADQFSRDITGCIAGTSLGIGQTCEISLNFAPITTGNKSASLTLITNSGTLDIPLNGTGTKPMISIQSIDGTPLTEYDLGVAQVDQTVFDFIFPTNTGTGNLIINKISLSGTDASLFVEINNCPDTNNSGSATQPLGQNGQCIIRLDFTPTSAGDKTAILSIESNDPDSPVTNINLFGTTGDPDIQVDGAISITSQVNGHISEKALPITNTGLAPLEITNISIANTTDFILRDDCTGTDVQVLNGESCSIYIGYDAKLYTQVATTLTIESNDPVKNSISIDVFGLGADDSDGVATTIEQLGPNLGDGNNDGISDYIQNNVVTLKVNNSEYITLIADKSTIFQATPAFEDLLIVGVPPGGAPTDAIFDMDLYSYSIALPMGDMVNVAMFLPLHRNPTKYYRYGPTPDNTTPHWYDFAFDSRTQTGALFLGRAFIESVGNAPIERNIVLINFIDGSRGDDDLKGNGRITHNVGGASFTVIAQTTTDDSGSLSIFLIILLTLSRLLAFRYRT